MVGFNVKFLEGDTVNPIQAACAPVLTQVMTKCCKWTHGKVQGGNWLHRRLGRVAFG
jgi:hypothetical protein